MYKKFKCYVLNWSTLQTSKMSLCNHLSPHFSYIFTSMRTQCSATSLFGITSWFNFHRYIILFFSLWFMVLNAFYKYASMFSCEFNFKSDATCLRAPFGLWLGISNHNLIYNFTYFPFYSFYCIKWQMYLRKYCILSHN